MNPLTWIAKAVANIFAFATDLIPTDKMREQRLEAKLPEIQGDAFIQIYNEQFIRLRKHDEIIIADDMRAIYPNMPVEQRNLLIKNLESRIYRWRTDTWRRRKRYKVWISKNQHLAQ